MEDNVIDIKEIPVNATLIHFLQARGPFRQVAVASKLGINASALSRSCNYLRNLSYVEVSNFCKCFDIAISDFEAKVESYRQDENGIMELATRIEEKTTRSRYLTL